jgi:hypothetical protein
VIAEMARQSQIFFDDEDFDISGSSSSEEGDYSGEEENGEGLGLQLGTVEEPEDMGNGTVEDGSSKDAVPEEELRDERWKERARRMSIGATFVG